MMLKFLNHYKVYFTYTIIFFSVITISNFLVCIITLHADLNDDLIAHYPLRDNTNDVSGNSYHGNAFGASLITNQYGNSSYKFDGIDDYINCNHHNDFNFINEFTISAIINLEELNRQNTILTKGSYFLKISSDNRVTFGARPYSEGKDWVMIKDTSEQHIYSLMTFKGNLYAATRPGADIYKSHDGLTWNRVISITDVPLKKRSTKSASSNTGILSFTPFNDYLYATSGCPTQHVYRSFDGNSWEIAFETNESMIHSITVYKNNIYIGTSTNGIIYRSSDGKNWEQIFDSSETSILCLAEFQGQLYASTSSNEGKKGKILRTNDGENWSPVLEVSGIHFYALCVYKDMFLAGTGQRTTGSTASIYKSTNGVEWVQSVELGETKINTFSVYSGYIYVGTGNSGKIYRSIDAENWNLVKDTSAVDIFCLAPFKGHLYAGTGDSGKIYRLSDEGFDIYSDEPIELLKDTHIVVTYNKLLNSGNVKLYINGNIEKVINSTCKIENNALDLIIGRSYGSTFSGFSSVGDESFNGSLKGIRIYDHALDENEIKEFYYFTRLNDNDDDGVINSWDKCPNTKKGLPTDKNGCYSVSLCDANGDEKIGLQDIINALQVNAGLIETSGKP